jgi:hypothetical protein
MQIILKFAVILAVAVNVAANFKAKAFQSSSDYPTPSDFPELELLKSKPNTAIAATGGGSRAYVAFLGYLAGLNELGLMGNVRYIGGISGGAWATTTYSYAQNTDDDKVLLGPVANPEDLTLDNLKVMDPNCARAFAAANLTLIGLQAWMDGTVHSLADAWVYGVSKTYLEPAGIMPNKYFSLNDKTVQEIIAKNPQLTVSDFTTVANSNRPFPIIGTALVGPANGAPYTKATQNYSMLEITPLYIGQMRTQTVQFKYNHGLVHKRTVGGMIEPFAFTNAGDAPKIGLAHRHTSGMLSVPEPTKKMDLAASAAASSYAPGSFVEAFIPFNLANTFGMHLDYWSPSDLLPSSEDTLFADGGSYQNIPLINFLQRRVSNIVLFFVAHTPLAPASKYNPFTDPFTGKELDDTLTAFFGVLPVNESNFENRSFEFERNQVFAKSDYAPVVAALQAAQTEGKGIFTTFNLVTVENCWWGIPAGISTQITFSYLGRLPQWEAKLSPEMKKLLVPADNADDLSNDVSSGPFRNFPHYGTLGGEVNHERANALADLTGWSVLQNADMFRKLLS